MATGQWGRRVSESHIDEVETEMFEESGQSEKRTQDVATLRMKGRFASCASAFKSSGLITDHFTCTSANVIYCITCTLCTKLYIGETGRRLGDRFREHLRVVEKDDQNASKPVARLFNLPNHSNQHMVVCGLSLHQGSTESRKTLEQKFIFQIGTLNPNGINERFSFN